MKDISKIIAEALETDGKQAVQEAVNRILSEGIEAGTMVAVIDDPIMGMSGAKGKVRGESSKGSGFVDVELANGTVMPMQSSLLVPV